MAHTRTRTPDARRDTWHRVESLDDFRWQLNPFVTEKTAVLPSTDALFPSEDELGRRKLITVRRTAAAGPSVCTTVCITRYR